MKIILLLSFIQLAGAQSLQPGIWKANSSFKVNGIPLPSDEQEECISPADAKDARATIAKELKRDGCKIITWNVKGTHIESTLSCRNDDIEAKGTLRGEFSTKSYDLSGDAEGTYQKMIPSTAKLKLTGHWVKACSK